MNGGGDTRVSIPINLRKAVQELKKTLGSKYNDEFVYTILKDCGMDPNEAGRRLKMIHDIGEIAGKHSVDDVYTMLKDCNMDPNEAAQRLLYIDTFHEVKKKQDRRKTINGHTSEEYKQIRGNQWRGAKDGRGTFYSSKAFDDAGGGRNLSLAKEYGVNNRLERISRPSLPVHSGKEDNVVHTGNSAANVNGTSALSNGSYSHKLASESNTLDTIVVSSQNTPNICAVGTIKCEIVKRSSNSNESNARIPSGKKFSADQVGAGTNLVIAEAADSDNIMQLKSDVVEKNQASESSQPLLSSTQNSSRVVNPNQDNGPLEVAVSEKMNISSTDTHSLPEEESEPKQSTPIVDVMLEKLTVSSHQAVIFPDHVQVPENYRNQFTFGSLDATLDDSKPLSVTESPKLNGEDVTQPSLSNQNDSTTAQEGESQDLPLPHLSENVLPSEDNIPSDSALKHDQTKVEILPLTGGFQNPVIQTTRDYSYGFLPHLMGPHFVQLDIPELQGGSSPAASALGPTPVTQPQAAIAAQSSIALSPPLFPYFRPYPNYIPYNPYFPHMYLPQNAHLLSHGVFPQPLPPSVHMQVAAAAAAAAGVKFPAPSQSKEGSDEEDIAASQAKENNNHSTVQQGEDPQVWAPALGRDVPNILPHYFYNFPQGHHMAFSPLQAALYHSSQTTQSTAQPLIYQPQATGGAVEPMVQPLTSYHQPQQTNRNNTALLNRDTS